MMLEIHHFLTYSSLLHTESNPDKVGDKIGQFFKTLTTSAPSIRDADKCDNAFATGMFLFQSFFDPELGGGITRYSSSISLRMYKLFADDDCSHVYLNSPLTGGTGRYLQYLLLVRLNLTQFLLMTLTTTMLD
jgi:hypothetical protein